MKLCIIGNGFDLHHKYKTNYSDYIQYLKKNQYNYPLGSFTLFNLFEDVAEDKFFWNGFEEALSDYPFVNWGNSYSERIDYSDDNDNSISYNQGLLDSFLQIDRVIKQAICKSMSDFIYDSTIKKANEDLDIKKTLDDDIFIINFNYSRTVETIYNIPSNKILYLHGKAYKNNFDESETYHSGTYEDTTIIFGHNTNIGIQQTEYDISAPANLLLNLNAHLIKKFQYQKLENTIKDFDISDIQIIGHSMGVVDEQYFKIINKQCINKKINVSYWQREESPEEEKIPILQSLFPNKNIIIKKYKTDE